MIMIKRILFFFLLMLLVAGGFLSWKLFGPAASSPPEKFFYIKTGDTFDDLSANLVSKKILRSNFWFKKASLFLRFRTARAGKYQIHDGMSLYQLIYMLKNGKQTPVNLVITKLRLKEDLSKKMGQLFEFDSTTAMQFLSNNDSLSFFGADTNTIMAYIIPDTYTYFWNTTPRSVLQKLYSHWKKFWTAGRIYKADQQGLTPLQVMILASIIDEESNYLPEKSIIASVYLNRIRKKMPLQADPTVKFALKDFTLKRIYQKHLMVESPYNTYKIQGLPPGPVCTPQPATIDAVLNAPKTEYLYFVAKSDFSGVHVFTANYKDHLKKAKEYQEALNRLVSGQKANQ